mgnify:CR=1 FL=1
MEQALRYSWQSGILNLSNKIIVASTFYKKDGAQPWLWEMMANPTFDGMSRQFKDAFLQVNTNTNALHRMYERDVARMQAFPEISEELMKTIKTPAFIITGDADVVTPEHTVQMYRVLPHARIAVFPCGHGDYIGEITTPRDTTLITATVSMIEKFLSEPMSEEN